MPHRVQGWGPCHRTEDGRQYTRKQYDLRKLDVALSTSTSILVHTFVSAGLADLSRLFGTVSRTVTFLVADSASAGEWTLDAWIGAVGFVVTVAV